MSFASFGVGFVVGFGSGFFSREALPVAREVIYPLSRVTIKSAVKAFENAREALSRMGEAVEDIFAEVRQDLKKEKGKKKKMRTKPVVVSEVGRTA